MRYAFIFNHFESDMKLIKTNHGELLGIAVRKGQWVDYLERVWLRSAQGVDFTCLSNIGLTGHIECDIFQEADLGEKTKSKAIHARA